MDFQAFAGIPITGHLDSQTITVMNMPRYLAIAYILKTGQINSPTITVMNMPSYLAFFWYSNNWLDY